MSIGAILAAMAEGEQDPGVRAQLERVHGSHNVAMAQSRALDALNLAIGEIKTLAASDQSAVDDAVVEIVNDLYKTVLVSGISNPDTPADTADDAKGGE